ncbi:MAG: hypothetical protein U1A78_38865 [Polyangia bacterium]
MKNLDKKTLPWRARMRVLLGLCALAGCMPGRPESEPAQAPAAPNRVDVSQSFSALVGQDGDYTVTAAGTIVNSYSVLGVGAKVGDKTVTVKNIADLNSPVTGMALKKGDLLLLYQAQGATIDGTDTGKYGSVTALNGAGSFEFVTVESLAGNVITIGGGCNGLRNSFMTPQLVQVVRVPQFNNLTIQAGAAIVAKAWDGASGGVVAIHVVNKTLIAGSIDVTAQGFRGGKTDAVSNAAGAAKVATLRTGDPMLGAEKGESIAGSQDDYQLFAGGKYGRGAPANGGGGGNAHNAGGGGGGGGGDPTLWTGQGVMDGMATGGMLAWALDQAYKDNANKLTTSAGGGRGGYTYSRPVAGMMPDPTVDGPTVMKWGGDNRQDVGGLGGRPLDPTPGFQIFMGGGGGAGDQDNSSGGNGGNGGGVVLLMSDSVVVPAAMTGFIKASGGDGADTTNGHNDAAGGGGGGGSIFVLSNQPLSRDVRLIADGGFGGSQKRAPSDTEEADGPGGGGGGGFISHTTTGSPTISISGTAGGTTVATTLAKFPANGATNGNLGRFVAAPRQPMVMGMPGYYPICLPSDLEVKVTPPAGQVQPGKTADFTVAVSNQGDNPATNASLTTTLPNGTDPMTVSWTCTASGGAMCPAAAGTGVLPAQVTLPVMGTLTYTVKVPVPSVNPMPMLGLTVAAQPAPGYTDPTPANNTGTGMASVVSGTVTMQKSDLEVTLDKSPQSAQAGDEITLTVGAKNYGPDKAEKPVVVFTLPPGSTVTQPPPSDVMAPWSCLNDGALFTCQLKSDLNAASNAPSFALKFKTPSAQNGATGTPQVTATIGATNANDPNPANNTAVLDVGPARPRPTADLALVLSKTPSTAGPGMETTWGVQVQNRGPETAPGAVVVLTLPPGSVVVQPPTGTGWACTRAGETLQCVTGAIQKGDATPLAVKVISPSSATPGAVTGVVSGPSSNDPNPLNNTDSKQVVAAPSPTGSDLAVRITADQLSPRPGDTVTYTAVASNRGPDVVLYPEVVINVPQGAKVTKPAAGDGWTCTQSGTAALCTRTSLAKGDAPPITLTIQYPPLGAETVTPPTTVVVSAPANQDPDLGNNTATADPRPTQPRSPADLSLSITKTPTTGGPGEEILYTLLASNRGPASSQNPSVTFSVPPSSTVLAPAAGSGWACTQSGYRFTCYRGGALQIGDAPPITVRINTPAPMASGQSAGAVVGVVSSPSTDDPQLLNNTAAISVGNQPATGSDLSVRINVTPQNPKPGSDATYTAEATNNGPDAVRNPAVVIQIPPTAEIVDGPSGDGWSCSRDASLVLCTRDSIPQGAAPVITVKVRVPNDGSSVPPATAVVNAPSNNDPKLENNTALSALFRFTGGGISCSYGGAPVGASGASGLVGLALSALALARRRRGR